MQSAIRNGPNALRTPIDVATPPKLVAAERNENSLEDERINTEYNPAAAAATSPAYEPAENELTENETSPAYVPSPEGSEGSEGSERSERSEGPEGEERPKSLLESIGSALGLTRGGNVDESSGGGGTYSVDDFQLGENVLFNRSLDLGFDSNQVWTVARKGGRLLTLKTKLKQLQNGEWVIVWPTAFAKPGVKLLMP
jgi:hypothetical protein